MKTLPGFSLGLVLALLTVSAPAPLVAADATPDNSYSNLAKLDSNFIVKAARITGEQVALARIAATRTSTPDVRALAEDLVTAHDAIVTSLARLAAAKTVTLDAPTADAVTRKWTDKKAADFEKDYVNEVAAVHERAVSLYQEVIRDGKDSDVTTLAREQLTALTDHLNRAQELQRQLK